MPPINILYVAAKYFDGQGRDFSYEHHNFFDTLKRIGCNIVHFDHISLVQKYGRQKANRLLLDVEKSENFDLMFTCLYTDQLDFKVIEQITSRGNCVTYNWFCDDRWRFNNYSCLWAPCFRWVSTTDAESVSKYRLIGYQNVIKTQWAYNHFLYTKPNMPLEYDVTFVGQKYGERETVINELLHQGIKVNAWGGGWPNGKLSQAQMNNVFNQSRINLNLSKVYGDPATKLWTLEDRRSIEKHLWHRGIEDTMQRHLPSRIGKVITTGSKLMKRLTASKGKNVSDYCPAGTQSYAPLRDIKARVFEVPSCGGFLLTEYAPGLEEYFDLNKQIISFSNSEETVGLVKFYLDHESERVKITEAGYQKTIHEHTYFQRFRHIFETMGLPYPSNDALESGGDTSSRISEVL